MGHPYPCRSGSSQWAGRTSRPAWTRPLLYWWNVGPYLIVRNDLGSASCTTRSGHLQTRPIFSSTSNLLLNKYTKKELNFSHYLLLLQSLRGAQPPVTSTSLPCFKSRPDPQRTASPPPLPLPNWSRVNWTALSERTQAPWLCLAAGTGSEAVPVESDRKRKFCNTRHSSSTFTSNCELILCAQKVKRAFYRSRKYVLLSRHQNAGQNRDIEAANRPSGNVSQFKYEYSRLSIIRGNGGENWRG
jgi:hypothetical protein